MEPAGTIVTEQPPDNADYGLCDGTFVEGWRYPDYRAVHAAARRHELPQVARRRPEIGRASCRERVCNGV